MPRPASTYLVVRVFGNIFSCQSCDIRHCDAVDDILVRLTGLQWAGCDVSRLGKQAARQKRRVAVYRAIDRQQQVTA